MRDYGRGNYTQYIIGRPRLVQTMTEMGGHEFECPNCHIGTVAEIQVVLQNMPLLKSEYAMGTYLSCPACPWASPMMCVSINEIPDWLTF